MSFDTSKLSYFHSYSKMPAQDKITLGNAINKSGHTVSATEVWASDIPYYGKLASLADVKAKVQPYASKNDMCFITAGDDKGKTFQYDGNGNWVDITGNIENGWIINNSKDEPVLIYHHGINLTNLTGENNANTDSENNSARLWVTINKDKTPCEPRLVEQFVSVTDKSLNGLASVAYAPVINNGTLVAGTDYYDYCYSGTILWAKTRSTVTPISCFEYIGKKVAESVSGIEDKLEEISNATLEGVVASVNVDAAAAAAGFSVNDDTATSPVIEFTGATSIDDGGSKLASAATVKTYVDAKISSVNEAIESKADATTVSELSSKVTEAETAIETLTTDVETLKSTISAKLVYKTVSLEEWEALTQYEVNTIYLVPEEGATGNYVEYLATSEETFEQIGSTATDLSGYATTDDVAAAQSAAEAAQSTANTAQSAAEAAQSAADAAQEDVDALSDTVAANTAGIQEAKNAANAAQSTANTAKEAADAAQTTADAAQAAAATNATAISANLTKIETAQATAENAQLAAADAQTAAEAAQTAADAAQATANEAKAAAATNAESIETINTNIATLATKDELAAVQNSAVKSVTRAEGDTNKYVDITIGGTDTNPTVAIDESALITTLATALGDIADLKDTVSPGSGGTNSLSSRVSALEDKVDVAKVSEAITAAITESQTALEADINAVEVIATEAKNTATKNAGDIVTLDAKVDALVTGVSSVSIDDQSSDSYDLIKISPTSGEVKVTVNTAEVVAAIADAKKAGTDAQTAVTTLADGAVADNTAAIATKASQSDLTALTGRVTDAEGEIDTLQTAVTTTLPTSIADAKKAGTDAQDAVTALAGRVETAEGEIDTLQSDVIAAKAQADKGVADAKAAQDAVDALDTRVETAKGEIDTLKGNVNTLTTAVGSNTTAITALQSTISSQLVYKVVSSLEEAETEKAENTIYLVPNTGAEAGTYIEYLCYNAGTLEEPVLTLEQIGSTKTNLTDYAKIADISGSVTVTNATDVSVSLADGKLSGSITADTAVTQNSSKLVTSGAVHSAIAALSAEDGAIHTLTTTVSELSTTVANNKDAADTGISEAKAAATTAQTAAAKRLTTIFKINPSDERFTIGTPEDNIVDGTKDGMKIGISLAENVATTDIFTTDSEGNPVVSDTVGTVYTKGQIDKKITDIIGGEISGISGGYVVDINGIVNENYEGKTITIDAKNEENYFGSTLARVSTSGTTISVVAAPAKEWAVDATDKPASTITSVTNGKASNGAIIDTENLTDGGSMFGGDTPNTVLTTVCSDFGKMTSAVSMFSGCTKLTSFCGDLSSLTVGTNMFSGCTALQSFCGDLGSLTTGAGMFAGCALNAESIDLIIDVLPTYAQTDAASHPITIANATTDQINTAKAKGWTVTTA